MNAINLVRHGQSWTIVRQAEVYKPARWADEGHFQRKCLQLGLPVPFQNQLHWPICAEFPFNPGIDLLYVAPAGRLVLAELKGESYNPGSLVDQTVGKFHAARTATVSDLLHYLHIKPIGHDVAQDAVKVAEQWIRQQAIVTSSTLEQLLDQNHLVLAVVVPGQPSPALLQAAHPPVVVYGIELAESYQAAAIYVDARNYRPASDPVVKKNLAAASAAHAIQVQYSGQRMRNRPLPVEVDAFFSSGRAPTGCAYSYRQLKQLGFRMLPGEDPSYSVMAQPLDATGKPRTLLRIFGKGTIELPGNLYQQQHQWSVSEATIDRLLHQVSGLFPAPLVNRQKGRNIEIWLDASGSTVSKTLLDQVIAYLGEFLAASHRAR